MMTTNAASLRGISVLALILLLGACGGAPRIQQIYHFTFLTGYRVTTVSPGGVEASIRVQEGAEDRTITGELIEVREDGFLILTVETSELTFLQYGRMVEMDFDDDVGMSTAVRASNSGEAWFSSTPNERIPPFREDDVRQRALARFSRYPFGLDDAQLQRLLEALGQSELVVIGS